MLYVVSLNPAIDKTLEIPHFQMGALNRVRASFGVAAGKGVNVVKTLKALGEPCALVCVLGGETGQRIRHAMEALEVETEAVYMEAPTRTNLKVFDPVSGLTTEINESGAAVNEETLAAVEDRLLERLEKDDGVILTGSLPPNVDASFYARLTGLCKAAGAKVYIDTDGEALRLAVSAAPFAIKPNLHELRSLAQTELADMDDFLMTGRFILDKGASLAAVTMGEEGALFLREKSCVFAKPPAVEAKNAVGAGDAMMAALAYAEAKSMPLEEAARFCVAVSTAWIQQKIGRSADLVGIMESKERVKVERLR